MYRLWNIVHIVIFQNKVVFFALKKKKNSKQPKSTYNTQCFTEISKSKHLGNIQEPNKQNVWPRTKK